MILAENLTGLASGSATVRRYTLNEADLPIVQRMLSRGIYSNPLRATIQELSSNALDAQVENGCGDIPITISLPNDKNDCLVISDLGIGINEHRMVNYFAKLAASTKRKTNTQLGGYGLGCKTGFSISDSFTVDTTADDLDGVRRRRVWAHFKEGDSNSYAQLSVEEVGVSKVTGTSISIPIPDWREKNPLMLDEIRFIFRYWPVKPYVESEIKVQWDLDILFEGDRWMLERNYSQESTVTAVVGGIPYVLNKSQLISMGVCYLGKHNLVMFFDTSEVTVLPTRESIDYDASSASLIRRFRDFETGISEELKMGITSRSAIETLELAKCSGLLEIEYNGVMLSTDDLDDYSFSSYGHRRDHPGCKLYSVDSCGGRELSDTVSFLNLRYIVGKMPSKEELEKYREEYGVRKFLHFRSLPVYEGFCEDHELFRLVSIKLPKLPKEVLTINRIKVRVVTSSSSYEVTMEAAKLSGFYLPYTAYKKVSVGNDKVYFVRVNDIKLLSAKAIDYKKVLAVRKKRKEIRWEAAKTAHQRKFGVSLVIGSNRHDRAKALAVLELPPFRLIRKQLRGCDGRNGITVDFADLVSFAYRGYLPSYIKLGSCRLRDMAEYKAVLKRAKPPAQTWAKFLERKSK